MKSLKTLAVVLLLAIMVVCATACSNVPANSVFNADDMMGKKIGDEVNVDTQAGTITYKVLAISRV